MIPRFTRSESDDMRGTRFTKTIERFTHAEALIEQQRWTAYNLSALRDFRKALSTVDTSSMAIAGSTKAWKASGYPIVTVSEMLAAELACTSLPFDLETIKSPWQAWYLVNDFDRTETVSVYNVGTYWEVRCVQHEDAADWQRQAATLRAATLAGDERTLRYARDSWLNETAAPSVRGEASDVFNVPTRKALDVRTRAEALMVSLVGNLCLAMNVGQVTLKAQGPVLPRAGRQAAPATLRAQAAVTIDLRPVLRAYIAGETGPRWRLAVRSHVRGFWRRPPGAQVDVKTVWVRPHWRGPRDGVLADRIHLVEAAETSRRGTDV